MWFAVLQQTQDVLNGRGTRGFSVVSVQLHSQSSDWGVWGWQGSGMDGDMGDQTDEES